MGIYVGTKTNTGSEIDKAGLTNGEFRFINVSGIAAENRTSGLANAGPVVKTGNFTLSATAATTFLRPEDGAWDTQSSNKFYFATTDRVDEFKDSFDSSDAGTAIDQVGRSRLWSLTFSDITDPFAGGTIEMLLDGTEAHQMFDNLTVDGDGNVIITEDVGNYARNGKVWKYNPTTLGLTEIAAHDVARFGQVVGGINTPATAPYNQDEEFSGVIDITDIMAGSPLNTGLAGERWYLMDDQAHYVLDTDLITPGIQGAQVEGGQLIAVHVVPEPSAALSLISGVAMLLGFRRRRA